MPFAWERGVWPSACDERLQGKVLCWPHSLLHLSGSVPLKLSLLSVPVISETGGRFERTREWLCSLLAPQEGARGPKPHTRHRPSGGLSGLLVSWPGWWWTNQRKEFLTFSKGFPPLLRRHPPPGGSLPRLRSAASLTCADVGLCPEARPGDVGSLGLPALEQPDPHTSFLCALCCPPPQRPQA